MVFLHLLSANYCNHIEDSHWCILLAKRLSSQTTNVLTLTETTGRLIITLNDFFQLWIACSYEFIYNWNPSTFFTIVPIS